MTAGIAKPRYRLHRAARILYRQIATADRCDDFVTPEATDTKSPELILAPLPPLAYARSG